MVNIITGPINSGKTSKLIEAYKELGTGDGFASIKNMEDGRVCGFDIMRLSTGIRKPLIRRKSDIGENWNECCSMGPYSFSDDAVKYVDKTVGELMDRCIFPVYLDEIGVMELKNECFHNTMKELAKSGLDLYLTVRDNVLDKVISKYCIENANVIYTGERYA